MTTPAEELRAAATVLRAALPGDLVATPRLVMTDAETISGVAFCVDHLLPRDFEHEFAACDHCEVIDCKYERLAKLVLALLLARDPLAAWLDFEARHEDYTLAEFGHRTIRDHVLATARAISGGTP